MKDMPHIQLIINEEKKIVWKSFLRT
jgi:hypothetical protein